MLKILVSYHTPAYIVRSDVYTPIHLGRACGLADSKDGATLSESFRWLEAHMQGDDTGENISLLNRQYCEMTAVYWAWKNYAELGNPDYVGFAHYRRFFALTPELLNARHVAHSGVLFTDFPPVEDVDSLVQGYDMLHPCREKVLAPTVRDNFEKGGLGKDGCDFVEAYISEHHPEWVPMMKEYMAGDEAYLYNMAIFRREVFFEYCEYIFAALSAYESYTQAHGLTLPPRRQGYVAELMTGLYIAVSSARVRPLTVLKAYDTQLPPTRMSKRLILRLKYLHYSIMSKFFALTGKDKKKLHYSQRLRGTRFLLFGK